jgi:hypothetical protein
VTEDEREDVYRREAERRRWIAGFREQQKSLRVWIAAKELLDWCAVSTTRASSVAATKAFELALARLDRAVRSGMFEGAGEQGIKWLHPRFSDTEWLTRKKLNLYPEQTIREQVGYCWLSNAQAKRWMQANGYQWHFEPQTDSSVAVAPSPPRPADIVRKRGKTAERLDFILRNCRSGKLTSAMSAKEAFNVLKEVLGMNHAWLQISESRENQIWAEVRRSDPWATPQSSADDN